MFFYIQWPLVTFVIILKNSCHIWSLRNYCLDLIFYPSPLSVPVFSLSLSHFIHSLPSSHSSFFVLSQTSWFLPQDLCIFSCLSLKNLPLFPSNFLSYLHFTSFYQKKPSLIRSRNCSFFPIIGPFFPS